MLRIHIASNGFRTTGALCCVIGTIILFTANRTWLHFLGGFLVGVAVAMLIDVVTVSRAAA